MRLGDLDALKEKLKNRYENEQDEVDKGWNLGIGVAINLIDNAPTVDPCYQTTSCLDCGNYNKENHNCPRFCEVIREIAKENQRLQGEWMPVSERLPEDRDWYLGVFREPDTGFIGLPYICDYIGAVTKGTTKEGWILRGFTDIDDVDDYIKSLECVAWQPLPEPYKAEMRGKEE